VRAGFRVGELEDGQGLLDLPFLSSSFFLSFFLLLLLLLLSRVL
jgi:hypothetical protein